MPGAAGVDVEFGHLAIRFLLVKSYPWLEGKEAFVNLVMTSSHLWPVGQPIGLFAKMLQYSSASQLDDIADKHRVTCPAKNAAARLAQIYWK